MPQLRDIDMDKNIICSVDSVVELLRAIKDHPDTNITPGKITFKVDNFTMVIGFNQLYLPTISQMMIVAKAGTFTRIAMNLEEKIDTLFVYMEEDGDDVDLVDEVLAL